MAYPPFPKELIRIDPRMERQGLDLHPFAGIELWQQTAAMGHEQPSQPNAIGSVTGKDVKTSYSAKQAGGKFACRGEEAP